MDGLNATGYVVISQSKMCYRVSFSKYFIQELSHLFFHWISDFQYGSVVGRLYNSSTYKTYASQ